MWGRSIIKIIALIIMCGHRRLHRHKPGKEKQQSVVYNSILELELQTGHSNLTYLNAITIVVPIILRQPFHIVEIKQNVPVLNT